MDGIITLRGSNQVLCNVWSYDFYDMTLATEWQRRHMIIDCFTMTLMSLFDSLDRFNLKYPISYIIYLFFWENDIWRFPLSKQNVSFTLIFNMNKNKLYMGN